MQEITYVVHIDDGVVLDDVLLEMMDDFFEDLTERKVVRSKIEDLGTIVENGEWEDDEDEQ